MPVIPPIWRTRPTTPEQHLAAAILAQAFSDIFGGASNQSQTRDTVDTIAVSAMRYLTDRHGQSAQWRNKWCDFLDLDGDVLAARVRMILDGKIDPPGDERFVTRLAVARDRWARISRKPPITRLPKIRVAADPQPDLLIPDDPFYVSGSGHIRASRRWADGEVSRFLGPLPSLRTKVGEALWKITQSQRAGANAMQEIGGDMTALVNALHLALPTCDLCWTSQGNRLPDYQSNAGLRVYLKQLAKAA